LAIPSGQIRRAAAQQGYAVCGEPLQKGNSIAVNGKGGITPPREGLEPAARVFSPTERDRILQAMIECCAERGYLETTVEDVLAHADVSRESFAALFSGKEECGVAALRKISSEVLTASSPGGGEVKLKRGLLGVKALVEMMASPPGYAYFGYVEARQGGTSRMHEIYESSARVLSAMIERARGSGERAAVPARAVRAALGGAEAVVRAEIAAGRVAGLPAHLPSLVYGVLVPVIGQGEALQQRAWLGKLIAESS
jgi:AcrR family transcriptional regulator